MRTYSSMRRKVSSALRITHVLKHSDVSEIGFTTTPSAYKGGGDGAAWKRVLAGTGAVVAPESGTQLAHRTGQNPNKTAGFD